MKKITNRMGILLLILASFSASSLMAADREDKRPTGCINTGYQMELRTLTLEPRMAGEQNSLYMVYNRSPESVNLYHMHHDDNLYNVYLNHKIYSGRWAGFSTSDPSVDFVCTVDERGLDYGRIVDCKDVLKVCEYTKVKFGLNNRGNLWIVNNNTRNGAVREVVRYGIIPAY